MSTTAPVQLDNAKVKDILSNLRPEALTAQLDSGEAQRALSAVVKSQQAPTKQDVVQFANILRTIARNTTEAEWDQYLRTGQLPEVLPLTPAQLESVRGGGWITDALGVVAVSVGIATVGVAVTAAACIAGVAIGAAYVYQTM